MPWSVKLSTPHDQGGSRGLLVRVEVVLGVDQVRGRARVRADQEVLVRPGAQLLAQIRRHMVGAAVDQVVRGHHAGHRARLDRLAEGTQVVLVQHARADGARRGRPVRLVVVREPVLEDRGRPPVRRVVAAQAPGVGGGDRGSQLRVLGVALLVAAPQGVAQEVDRGRPDVEADAVVARAHRAGLGGDRLADPAYEFVVPGRAEADRLGEHRRRAHPGHPVQCLLAGAEGGDAESLHRGPELVQHRDPFLQGEPRQKIVDALRERQLRVAEKRRLSGHARIPLWKVGRTAKVFRSASMLIRLRGGCQDTQTQQLRILTAIPRAGSDRFRPLYLRGMLESALVHPQVFT